MSKSHALRKRRDVDMTTGNIARHIITFALPLLAGNIFQQLYNAVDTWVVGNFGSTSAYSAVGTVGPIVNILIGVFIGLSSGAGVVISQYYGAHREEDVQNTVHTAVTMTLILSVIFAAAGIAITPAMLNMMKMDPSIQPAAKTYLTIYFAGIIGLMIYNIGSGILRAVGDSRRPFYYLVVCAILNTVLDLIFVIALDMDVAGVALATVISQCVSAILILITLMRSTGCVRIYIRKLRIDWPLLKKICSVGIPAALQMCITSFSNVFVQSYINFFGPNSTAGWTTYSRVDQVLFLPMQSISLASTTFVGQNLGSNQPERARKGVRISLWMALTSTVILTIPVVAFAPQLAKFFNPDPNVVRFGTLYLRWLSPFYILCCYNQIYSGALRGAGNTRAPMVIMLISFVAFRQLYLFVMHLICNEAVPIAMSYPAGWLLASILTTIYYRKIKLSKTRLVEQ